MRTEAGAIAFALGVLVPTYETFKLLMKEVCQTFDLRWDSYFDLGPSGFLSGNSRR